MPVSIIAMLIVLGGTAAITISFIYWLKRHGVAVSSSAVEPLTIVVAALTWVGVGVAAWGIVQLKDDLREVVQATISVELDKEFDSTEMRRARRMLADELLRGVARPETRVIDFFEKVSLYQGLHRIDDDTVYTSFSYYIERYWVASHAFIQEFRKEQKDNGFYDGFEQLNEKMLTMDVDIKEKHRKKSGVMPTPAEVERFLKEEARLAM